MDAVVPTLQVAVERGQPAVRRRHHRRAGPTRVSADSRDFIEMNSSQIVHLR